jgi:gas vesicle protein
MKNRNTDPTALLVGFIAGGLIGASLALLFAPAKGKRLRADIRRRAENILDDAEEYIDTAGGKASDVARTVRKESGQLLGGVQKRASELIDTAEQVLQKGGRG